MAAQYSEAYANRQFQPLLERRPQWSAPRARETAGDIDVPLPIERDQTAEALYRQHHLAAGHVEFNNVNIGVNISMHSWWSRAPATDPGVEGKTPPPRDKCMTRSIDGDRARVGTHRPINECRVHHRARRIQLDSKLHARIAENPSHGLHRTRRRRKVSRLGIASNIDRPIRPERQGDSTILLRSREWSPPHHRQGRRQLCNEGVRRRAAQRIGPSQIYISSRAYLHRIRDCIIRQDRWDSAEDTQANRQEQKDTA